MWKLPGLRIQHCSLSSTGPKCESSHRTLRSLCFKASWLWISCVLRFRAHWWVFYNEEVFKLLWLSRVQAGLLPPSLPSSSSPSPLYPFLSSLPSFFPSSPLLFSPIPGSSRAPSRMHTCLLGAMGNTDTRKNLPLCPRNLQAPLIVTVLGQSTHRLPVGAVFVLLRWCGLHALGNHPSPLLHSDSHCGNGALLSWSHRVLLWVCVLGSPGEPGMALL